MTHFFNKHDSYSNNFFGCQGLRQRIVSLNRKRLYLLLALPRYTFCSLAANAVQHDGNREQVRRTPGLMFRLMKSSSSRTPFVCPDRQHAPGGQNALSLPWTNASVSMCRVWRQCLCPRLRPSNGAVSARIYRSYGKQPGFYMPERRSEQFLTVGKSVLHFSADSFQAEFLYSVSRWSALPSSSRNPAPASTNPPSSWIFARREHLHPHGPFAAPPNSKLRGTDDPK